MARADRLQEGTLRRYRDEGFEAFAYCMECTPPRPSPLWKTYITHILDLIVRVEIYSQQALDAYLIHRFLVDLLPHVLPSVWNDEKFYLKHADDKGDHILVDAYFSIPSMTDWRWAHNASPARALSSPVRPLPVADFYAGKNYLRDDEIVLARLLEERPPRSGLCCGEWPTLAEVRMLLRIRSCCGLGWAPRPLSRASRRCWRVRWLGMD